MQTKKQVKTVKIIGIILLLSLALSVVYSLVRFIIAPSEIAAGAPYEKVKTDYLLMLTQCMLGLLVMMLPTFVARKWKIVVPNIIVILYYVFLYCAIYLGEVRNFYYLISFWDDILHAFSGAMLGALGFILIDLLNKDKKVSVNLSPLFVSVFAFCFALSVGALWEVYEFSLDAVLGLNMQKHTTDVGRALAGNAALLDTMKDIIIDAAAALSVAVFGYFTNKKSTKEKE